MDWVYYLLLLFIQLIGLALALFQMPGLWLMLAGVGVYAWITAGQGYVSGASLIVLLLLTILSEVVEFAAGGAGAKKAGASRLAILGAMVGGVVGAIVGTVFILIPIAGTIIGACVGSFLGATAIEWWKRRDIQFSLQVGFGAAQGRLLGILGKLAIGVILLLATIVIAIPIGGTPLAVVAPTTGPSTTILVPATQP
jgi:uncharacterized protein YqgC (DUF456 family)